MKKVAIISICIFLIGVFSFISCKKTSSTSSTSSSTTTAIASPSVNTTINIGGTFPGWVFNACGATPNHFEAYNGPNTRARLFYNGPMSSLSSGTYTFTTGTPGVGQVQLILNDPPGQPSGFVWYSNNSQTCSINVISVNNVVASFTNIACAQSTSSTPIVTASGTLTCP